MADGAVSDLCGPIEGPPCSESEVSVFRTGLIAMAATLLALPWHQVQIYRSTADMVPVFVTVTDRAGRLVTDLLREDFEILDNGRPQPISVFDNSPQPLRLVVLIDASGSMDSNLPLLRAACLELIRHLSPNDLARVGSFGEEITIGPSFTRDAEELARWLPTEIPPNTPTPLWNAIDQAVTELAGTLDGRRVVLVLSDGKDSGPRFGRKIITQIDASERAQRADVMVYGVGVRSSLSAAMRSRAARTVGDVLTMTLPDPGLGTVALDTGGGYFEVRGDDNLASSFARVVDELHQQYLLGFVPPAKDGKVHKIEVRTRRAGMKPRVRKSYVAPR